MTTSSAVWSFALVVGLLTLTPGLDTALIVRTAAAGQPRRAWGVVVGIQTGTLIWGILTSLGIAALLTASALVYEVLRWAGAAYLVWMGVTMVWATHRPAHAAGRPEVAVGKPAATTAGERGSFSAAWRRGAATNLLNPKMGAFYVALLPQFIPEGASPLTFGVLLACVHITLGVVWSTVPVLMARRLRRVLQRPSVRRAMDRATGTVIAGFGVKLAMSSR
ncbi:LysE family translocator [Kineococcus sp. NPDC059986]|uniref:LysE family translocator n=1 Tax=Kineococcus sp. NPDC059986 TaxID=3155538 RepID=UPI00344C78CC